MDDTRPIRARIEAPVAAEILRSVPPVELVVEDDAVGVPLEPPVPVPVGTLYSLEHVTLDGIVALLNRTISAHWNRFPSPPAYWTARVAGVPSVTFW